MDGEAFLATPEDKAWIVGKTGYAIEQKRYDSLAEAWYINWKWVHGETLHRR